MEESASPPVEEQTPIEVIADKVGFLPNLRRGDNVLQARSVLAGMTLGVLVCEVLGWPTIPPWKASSYEPLAVNAIVGAILGLIAGAFLSGFYLMIRNLKR